MKVVPPAGMTMSVVSYVSRSCASRKVSATKASESMVRVSGMAAIRSNGRDSSESVFAPIQNATFPGVAKPV